MQSNNSRKTKIYILIVFIAVLIASLPLIRLLFSLSKEKIDEANEDFAAQKASEILTSVVNNIPFAVLKSGNPAYLQISETTKQAKYVRYNAKWAKDTIESIFCSKVDETADKYICSGTIQNGSGTKYLVQLKVEDVLVSNPADAVGQVYIGKTYPSTPPNEFPKNQKLTFAFIKDPLLFSNGTWLQSYVPKRSDGQPFLELDLPQKTAVSPQDLYTSEDFLNPVAERKYPKLENSDCLLKKLILQMQWFDTDGKPMYFHLITVKGELD